MSNLIIDKLLEKSQRTDLPAFNPGDTVRVHVKIKEGDKERVQAFEDHADREQLMDAALVQRDRLSRSAVTATPVIPG